VSSPHQRPRKCVRDGSDQNYKSVALNSYNHCLRLWARVNIPNVPFSFHKQSRWLEGLFSSVEEADCPKAFKGLLADFFSIQMKQPRPSVIIDGEKLFYPGFRRKLQKDLDKSVRSKLRLCWDLMQCKAMSAEAPKSMVLRAYQKHAETLSQVKTTKATLLKDFRLFIQPWVNGLVPFLNRNSRLPNSHATFDTKRSTGGTLVDQMSKINKIGYLQPDCPRIDPTCVFITGKPGTGKSLLQSMVINRLSKILKKDWEEMAYTRSSVMKHWDGYSQQPLTVIDDFGQQNIRNGTPSQEIVEFIQMCSTVDYRLPMADLKQKGMKFTSPLILLSSNLSCSSVVPYMTQSIMSGDAALRRFTGMFELRKDGKTLRLYQHTIMPDALPRRTGDNIGPVMEVANGRVGICDFICQFLLNSWREKSQTYSVLLDGYFHQPLGGDWFLSYPEEPSHHNQVKAQAILEPLKVRMITVGSGDNWALKPLQKAMFNALSRWKCFKPCFTPDYDKEIEELMSIEGNWLSGDYSAATDGLHSQIMGVAIEQIANILQDYSPELIPYLLKEGLPHTVVYPPWTGIEPITQTNGQLMGSLLSFPILCLANAFTICKATGTSLETLPGLIHGDDVLARLNRNQFSRWGTIAGQIGLELSIGKNYYSPRWGSIDSQIFFEGKRIHECGKWKGLSSGQVDSVTTLLQRGFPKPLIVDYCRDQLKKSHRSLEVSREYGGLSPLPDLLPTSATDHAVYLRAFRAQLKFRKVLDEEFAVFPEEWLDSLPLKVVRLPFELPRPDTRKHPNHEFHTELRIREKGLTVPVGGFVPLSSVFCNAVVDDRLKSFLKNFIRSRSTVLSPDDKNYFTCLAQINSRTVESTLQCLDPPEF